MSATSYITADDMRGNLYPSITVPTTGSGSISDARLLAMGTAASRRVDAYCNDHFHATTAGTMLLEGNNRYTLALPKRVRSVTGVTLIDFEGTATSVDADFYRVETSFDNVTGSNISQSATGTDALLLRKPLDVGEWSGNWPPVPWLVQVVGDFDWAETPEEVKHATAMIVWVWARSEVPPDVETIDSATLRYTRPRPGADSTGVVGADQLLDGFRRTQYGRLMHV